MVMLALLIAFAIDTHATSDDYDRCMATGDAAAGITVAMMDCTGAEIARQDARLNQVYRARIATLPSAKAAALRSTEHRWIKARDGRCQTAARAEGGGSLAGLLYAQCILRETTARVRWLEGAR